MGCIPFCCFMKNISPKKFAIIGLVCNIVEAIIAIFISILDGFKIIIFEFLVILSNLVPIINLTQNIFNGSIYDENNKRGKIIYIIVLIVSSLILLLRFIFLIIAFIYFGQKSRFRGGLGPSAFQWCIFLIPNFIFTILVIIHFLSVNYLYKLIRLKSNVSYNEYLKNGETIGQVSVIIANSPNNQNPPIFPYNNQNKIPNSNQENTETESNKNIK